MPDGKSQKRDYDNRSQKVKSLISDLLEMGVSPRVVEIDGFRVELGQYRPEPATRVGNGGVLAADERRTAEVPRSRSYRQVAREDLRKRLREVES